MAAYTQAYNNVLINMANGKVNPNSNTFKMILVHGYTFDPTHNQLTDVNAFEIAAGGGYSTGGITLTGRSWTNNGAGKTKLDFDDASLTLSGAVGPVQGAIVYSDTSAQKNVLCYIDFDGDVSGISSDQFVVAFGADGLLCWEE